jgi:hypothetical protein
MLSRALGRAGCREDDWRQALAGSDLAPPTGQALALLYDACRWVTGLEADGRRTPYALEAAWGQLGEALPVLFEALTPADQGRLRPISD